jgi:hypothetical protein
MMESGNQHIKKTVTAWLLMVSAIAIHVIDEAVTGFLPLYNQTVGGLRQNLGFFPAPTFTFPVWLGGLIVLILLCYILTPVVRKGGKFIKRFVFVLSIIMIANGLGHMLGSVYFGRILPGFWSSPILLATAVYLLIILVKGFKTSG